jgi:threonine dehydrogenase-like Zn-dependent dehydrogenase
MLRWVFRSTKSSDLAITNFHILGHENMGTVVETGPGVSLIKKGDRVVMPFNVADGRCRNCEEGYTAFCTGVNP